MIKTAFYSFINFFLTIPNFVLYSLLFISLCIWEYYYFNIDPDISIQLNTLVNFVNGHGISLSSLNQNNQITYTQVSHWPAGLAIFLSPIYLITKSTVGSTIILNAICYFFYILFLDKYLKYLKIDFFKKKFIILFLAISVAPFIHFYPSDTLATIVCLWGFYFTNLFLDTRKKYNLFLALFFLGISYFVRYSFLPFIFYPFAAFLFKEKKLLFQRIRNVILLLLACLLTTLLFYHLNKTFVGTNHVEFATSLDLFHGNGHWNQLSHFAGFLFTFGIYDWVLQNFFKNHLGVNIQFNWISLLVTIYFYVLFLKIFFKAASHYSKQFYNSINISLFAGALLIFFLIFLTLNNPGQTWSIPYWTYVQETRYFGPIIVISLINILIIFLTEKKGIFIHVLIPLMILLNLYAYRTVVQSGFWGRNYAKYLHDRNRLYEKVPMSNEGKSFVFYYVPEMKNTIPYLILQSQGEILAANNSSNNFPDEQYSFLLEKDSVVTFKISLIKSK